MRVLHRLATAIAVFGLGCLPGPSAAVTVTTVYLPGYPSGNPPVPLELVSVSPGSFQMGSVDPGWSLNNEQPVHTVNIAYPLQVGRFEVTQRQWVSLMHSNPSYWTGDDTRPVEQVTWLDVCGPGGYLEKLNQYIASTGQGLPEFRLPSEAEWEYACRGGSTTRFYFGDSDCASSWICNACSLGNYGWFCGNSGGTPHVVGGKLPNAFGLYDMLGNVSEWCQDIILPDPLLPTYVGAPTDGSPWYPEGPAGTLIKRVHRGGFYYGYPTNCRSATRSGADSGNPGVTDFKSYSLGFRLARFEKSVVTYADNTFATGAVVPPGGTGWTSFGFNTPGFAYPDYNAAAMAYRCWVATDPTKFRDVGLNTNPADWLPYSIINGNRVVRAKYMIYAGGQSNPADQNQVPNMRLRLCNRFAINSMLEVFNHDPNDAAAVRSTYAELRPSTLPASPSVFRVDLDPIDIPYLYSNSSTEGFQRGFEAYAIYPADQGYLAMTESVIGSYPSTLMPSSIAPVKTYATDPTNAGDLAVYAVPTSSELSLTKLIPGATEGAFATTDPSAPQPTYSSGNWGVTLDTTTIPSDRIGVATRNFNPDRGTNAYASRVRVEEGRQYQVRFHLISSQQTNAQAQIRLRGRSIKFGWSQKFEIGGAWGTDGGKTYPLNQNNSIAQQAVPGFGCLNPDKRVAGEAGGWYSMVVLSPMETDIRPEYPVGTPLAVRMPLIALQPGPGDDAPSMRDLLFGMDLVDSLSAGMGAPLERGNVTLDRIEVRSFILAQD